jgi:hypothetical protein
MKYIDSIFFFFFCFEIFLHLKLHCVTVTNSISSFSHLRQGGQTATELSMRRAATSGQSGVVPWWRHGSRSIVGELGLCIDVGEDVIGGPQLYLLVSSVVADRRLRLG